MADRSMNTGWQLLKPLLEENKNTEYGRKYHFSDVNSIDDYKKMVPLSTFDDYENYVERMKAGEKDILTSYELLTFCTTSGTSKKRIKYIPQTKKQHEIYPGTRRKALLSADLLHRTGDQAGKHAYFGAVVQIQGRERSDEIQ